MFYICKKNKKSALLRFLPSWMNYYNRKHKDLDTSWGKVFCFFSLTSERCVKAASRSGSYLLQRGGCGQCRWAACWCSRGALWDRWSLFQGVQAAEDVWWCANMGGYKKGCASQSHLGETAKPERRQIFTGDGKEHASFSLTALIMS